jgi:hypothetical protein
MRALILVAALTVACTTFAGAADVKKDTSKASVVTGKTMTEADMDKVTAGVGYGIGTACANGGTCTYPNANYHAYLHANPGHGINTR